MEKFLNALRQQAAVMRGMPLGKKLQHIWLYYRWHILAAFLVLCVVVSLVQQTAYNRKEPLISGVFVNNSTSAEGYAHLKESYLAYCGDDGRHRVELVEARQIDFGAEVLPENDAANFMLLTSMISARALDYIITDEATLAALDQQEVVMDLTSVLPQAMQEELDVIRSSTGIIGIRLADTSFARNYPLSAGDSCILIVSNTPSTQNVLRFLEYLFNA